MAKVLKHTWTNNNPLTIVNYKKKKGVLFCGLVVVNGKFDDEIIGLSCKNGTTEVRIKMPKELISAKKILRFIRLNQEFEII